MVSGSIFCGNQFSGSVLYAWVGLRFHCFGSGSECGECGRSHVPLARAGRRTHAYLEPCCTLLPDRCTASACTLTNRLRASEQSSRVTRGGAPSKPTQRSSHSRILGILSSGRGPPSWRSCKHTAIPQSCISFGPCCRYLHCFCYGPCNASSCVSCLFASTTSRMSSLAVQKPPSKSMSYQ